MRLTVVVSVTAFAALACHGNDEDETAPVVVPPGACAVGEWLRDDGVCMPAGLPGDLPCSPGEWLDDDGACIPAGVPPDGCGEGFLHDGDRGCEPILPSEPCASGFMAVPGATSCREIAPCATGKWGDIPVEPNSEYVDASYAAMDSDGSALKPWTSIQAGVDAAVAGAIVAIAAGSYNEDITVSGKPVRLWGVCPALVEVEGTGAELAAVAMWEGASATEVVNLALRGSVSGVFATGSVDVLLERVWVHDTASQGVHIENSLGPTSMALRDSLVERSHESGIFAAGSDLSVEASVVRDTQLDAEGESGRGMEILAHPIMGTPATLVLRNSLIERSYRLGVYVGGSEATVEGTVVRDTRPDAHGVSGRGLNVRAEPTTSAPSTLVLRRSLVEQSHTDGVFLEGSSATIEASVVRHTQMDAQGLFGRGVELMPDPATEAPSKLLLHTSLIQHNHDLGLFVAGSEATIEASVVRDTQPTAEPNSGGGVSAHFSPTAVPSTLLVRNSVLERNHDLSLFVNGSRATVEGSVMRDTRPDVLGDGGRGLSVQGHAMTAQPSTLLLRTSLIEQSPEIGVFIAGSEVTMEASVIRGGGRGMNARTNSGTGTPSTLTLRGLLVEQSQGLGVGIFGSVATVESCVVRDTVPDGAGLFGDGIIIMALGGAASATITATRVDKSARAAVAAHGAHVAIRSSELSCQAIDLAYDTLQGAIAKFEDLGGNRCGCPEATESCKALSAGLEPPEPLESAPSD